MSGFIHGIATIKRNGENIVCDVDAKLKIGGIVNETQMVGYRNFATQKIVKSELELQIPHTNEVDLIKEQASANVEIQFQSDNGAVYVIATASQVNELDTGDDGMVGLKYEGSPATKA